MNDRDPEARGALCAPAAELGGGTRGRGGRYGRFLALWVDGVRRHALTVALLTVLTAIGGGYHAATDLEIQTDTSAMISKDMAYRKIYDAFETAFPQLNDNLVIDIEGPTADQAEDVADALARKLEARPDLFPLVFATLSEPFFRENGLLYLDLADLQALANRLADAEPLIATLAEDMSLRGLFDVLGQGIGEIVDGEENAEPLVRLLRLMGDTVAARLAGRSQRLSWREVMSPTPLKPSDKRKIILAQPASDLSNLTPIRAAIAAVRQAAATLDPALSDGVRVRITGSPAIRRQELESVKGSVGFASLLSLALVTVIVFIGLRAPRLVFATIVTLFVGLMWTAWFAAVAIGHLNLISIAFAVLFIGLAVDFGIQFGLRYKEIHDAGGTHRESLRAAAASTGAAVGLAALCAMIGFLSFVPTNYVGLAELGIIAGVGMFFGVLGAFTSLPAILTLLPLARAPRAGERLSATWLGRLQERHARAIGIGALLVGIAALAALPEARFDIDPINVNDPTTESVRTFMDLARDSETSPYSSNVVVPSLDEAAALAERLERLAVVDSTVTLLSFVPEQQDEKLDVIDQMALFLTPVIEFTETQPPPTPAERRAAVRAFRAELDKLIASPYAGDLAAPARRLAELLGRYADRAETLDADYAKLEAALVANLPGRLAALREGMYPQSLTVETLPEKLRRRYLTPDGRARVEIYPVKELTDAHNLREFVDAVQRVAPNATDTPVLLLKGGDAVIDAFETAGALAFVAISLLLIAVLRSVVDSVLVLLPIALAGVLVVAVTAGLGIPFNLANIITLPLLLSLGVAFGIYLVMRYRETGSVTTLLQSSTPRAVLYSALTTMASFGTLMISSHRGIAGMGELLAISLTLALLCSLIVLPALLAWRGRRGGGGQKAGSESGH